MCYRRISLWVFSTTLSILHYKHSPAHALQMEKRKPFVRFDRSLLSFQKALFATPNKEHSDLISVPSLNMWTLYTLLVCLCVCARDMFTNWYQNEIAVEVVPLFSIYWMSCYLKFNYYFIQFHFLLSIFSFSCLFAQ